MRPVGAEVAEATIRQSTSVADAPSTGVGAVAADAVDVILRDGTTLRLRPPVAADLDALVAFFGGLSERSLYLRFHGVRHVDRALAEPFVDPDWTERGARVGT